ncbi:hypothetical protein B2J93_9485 [Marssonina coronariae]|uniref:Uncharacterized protein n=1 Tax=Diplocarpon coronariae TaxID=2795749 RepID=A0A218YVC3_9HELO|nr:hypothetical protein B2J93_9485 [Marssonina coronariae]
MAMLLLFAAPIFRVPGRSLAARDTCSRTSRRRIQTCGLEPRPVRVHSPGAGIESQVPEIPGGKQKLRTAAGIALPDLASDVGSPATLATRKPELEDSTRNSLPAASRESLLILSAHPLWEQSPAVGTAANYVVRKIVRLIARSGPVSRGCEGLLLRLAANLLNKTPERAAAAGGLLLRGRARLGGQFSDSEARNGIRIGFLRRPTASVNSSVLFTPKAIRSRMGISVLAGDARSELALHETQQQQLLLKEQSLQGQHNYKNNKNKNKNKNNRNKDNDSNYKTYNYSTTATAIK